MALFIIIIIITQLYFITKCDNKKQGSCGAAELGAVSCCEPRPGGTDRRTDGRTIAASFNAPTAGHNKLFAFIILTPPDTIRDAIIIIIIIIIIITQLLVGGVAQW